MTIAQHCSHREPVPLSGEELRLLHAYWRAANYLSVGQIYLLDNPLLKRSLERSDIKPRLLGHWGTTPGLNFIYVHLNRVIRQRDLNMIYVCGPGHGGPAMVANTWLEGSYTECYPEVSQDEAGMRTLFRQFSFPGGIPSHVSPDIPGSINEGGELGYSLAHAYGAAFDNPDLIVTCVVGDGEAETGPLAASWHSNKFLNPEHDGAVLPILHLNGYKIANPTVLARIPHDELRALMVGQGHDPIFVEGYEPEAMHRAMAAALDQAVERIREIQRTARSGGAVERPLWPMIVLRSPKGWTGPTSVDGKKTEGSWRSHQVPLANLDQDPVHLRQLEEWLRSYRPEELFDGQGQLMPELQALIPEGERRMGANPHANGGRLSQPLNLPPLAPFAVEVPTPGGIEAEDTRVMGEYLFQVMENNKAARNFRLVGPDETASNRLDAVFRSTPRTWMAGMRAEDVDLSPDGRVLEVLSEHLCQGWLEGYLLTGRHGLFSCYEAFIHIVDSMFNQHAKWLDACRKLDWRAPVPSLNYLLTSHVWRQDHNGFSHQDPGFIDLALNKKPEIVRAYLPPDANSLLWVTRHILGTWNRVNIVVAGKQPSPQWLNLSEAAAHCSAGIGRWDWASSEGDDEPDLVMACAGDVPTMETLAAVSLLRSWRPELKLRVVNVVDLMTLFPDEVHEHGLPDAHFDALFTVDRPVLFAYHGYPWTIHRLTYRRANHDNLHVRGYREEGTTTTPFDMTVRNGLSRYNLVLDALRYLGLGAEADDLRREMKQQLDRHYHYIREHGQDLPEVLNWRWPGAGHD